jgi:DNA-binding SARP family transcriptional activator
MIHLSAGEQPASASTADLSIHLLGLPIVQRASAYLEIPRREVRALLYRLATRLEPVSREQLCFLFWPDTPESSARRALSHLLTHLRNALPRAEAVLTWDEHIGLDPQYAWSDTAAFEQLRTASATSTRVEALQQAVVLYRGPFLSGISLNCSAEFELWVLGERRAWERLYLESLAVLIEAETAHSAYEAAITYAQRYLCADDLAEEVHRRLIELYAAIGDRAAAIRQFESCTAVLGSELGVSPQPMTWAAYRVVREGGSPLKPVTR